MGTLSDQTNDQVAYEAQLNAQTTAAQQQDYAAAGASANAMADVAAAQGSKQVPDTVGNLPAPQTYQQSISNPAPINSNVPTTPNVPSMAGGGGDAGNNNFSSSLQGGISGKMMGGMMSDVNTKTNISPGDQDVRQFLSTIVPQSWDYKDPARDGQGRFTGIMAQDLQKSKAGQSAIIPTANGLMVDGNRLSAINAASNAVLYKEVEKLNKLYSRLDKRFKK